MDSLNLYTSKEIYITNNLYEYIREVMEMPGRLSTAEEKYNIIMESFQNPNITIAEICRNHGLAVSLFYKWDNDGSFRSIMWVS